MKKKQVANLIMVAIILVIVAAGVAGVGFIRGWFDKEAEDAACLTDVQGIVNMERSGVIYPVEQETVLRNGDRVTTQPGASAVIDRDGDRITLGGNVELIIMELMIPFFMAFEGRKPQARELVVIAVMCAIAIVARVAIPIPHFKAIFAVIMLSGIAFGPEAGFMIGAVSALASNFFYGQGAYTPLANDGLRCRRYAGRLLLCQRQTAEKAFDYGGIRFPCSHPLGRTAVGLLAYVPDGKCH